MSIQNQVGSVQVPNLDVAGMPRRRNGNALNDTSFQESELVPKRLLEGRRRRRVLLALQQEDTLEGISEKSKVVPEEVIRICEKWIESLPLNYVDNEIFHVSSDDKSNKIVGKILSEMPEAAEYRGHRAKVPAGLPLYLASLYEVPLLTREQEGHLFRKMNYLKYEASRLRSTLQGGGQIAAWRVIAYAYSESTFVRSAIVRANLRLVISIAKHFSKSQEDLFELISDGNISLFRAVEKFNFALGNKFSTYATWAIRKNFARSIPDGVKHYSRYISGGEKVEGIIHDLVDERRDHYATEIKHSRDVELVARLLANLDERELVIAKERNGIGCHEPRTLQELGNYLGVSKERIRQLEARAYAKLRKAHAEIEGTSKVDKSEDVESLPLFNSTSSEVAVCIVKALRENWDTGLSLGEVRFVAEEKMGKKLSRDSARFLLDALELSGDVSRAHDGRPVFFAAR